MSSLSLEQRAALEARGGTVLVAGPGSGKTTTLVEKYLGLLASGATPDEIVVVTFTRASATELRLRAVKALTQRGADEKLRQRVAKTTGIGTIHGFCLELARDWSTALGLPSPKKVVGELEVAEGRRLAFDEAWAALDEKARAVLAAAWSPADVRAVVRVAGERRLALEPKALRFPGERAPFPQLALLLTRFFAAVDDRFVRQGRYSFGDLEMVAWRLLRESAEARADVAARVKHLLVDEFQDTSAVQWDVLRATLGNDEALAWEKLFAVGDPRQSIYRFRHAEPALFRAVGEAVIAAQGEQCWLRANYRSTPPLLAAINGLAETLFADDPLLATAMEPGQSEGEYEAPVEVVRYDGSGQRAEGRGFEAGVVAERIARGTTEPSEVAVLFRSTDTMGLYAEELARRNIPVAGKRAVALFSCPEAEDFRWVLRAIAEPTDDFAVAAFLRSHFVRADEASLLAWADGRGKLSLLQRASQGGSAAARWLAAQEGAKDSLALPLIEAFFAEVGGTVPLSIPLAAVLDGLDAAWTVAQSCEALERWRADGARVEVPFGEKGVRLLTVHGAKGLEFEDIYLVDLLRTPPRSYPSLRVASDGRWAVRTKSAAQDADSEESLEYEALAVEERNESAAEAKRLLYVAATRAKRRLVVALPEEPCRLPAESWAAVLAPFCVRFAGRDEGADATVPQLTVASRPSLLRNESQIPQ